MLDRLSWRSFARRKNPVASAVSAKMKMRPHDRPKARAEGFRTLAGLKLDAARSRIVGAFVESYLTLTAAQTKRYEDMIAAFAPPDREATMGLITSWEQRGIEQGIEQGIMRGKEELVLRLIRRRLGAISADLEARLERLTSDQLDDLGEFLFDFTSVADLEQWLAQHST